MIILALIFKILKHLSTFFNTMRHPQVIPVVRDVTKRFGYADIMADFHRLVM